MINLSTTHDGLTRLTCVGLPNGLQAFRAGRDWCHDRYGGPACLKNGWRIGFLGDRLYFDVPNEREAIMLRMVIT